MMLLPQRIAVYVALSVATLIAMPAQAATVTSFSATIFEVSVDSGTGTYAGTAVGDTFTGSIVYGDNISEASLVHYNTDTTEAAYYFLDSPFGISVSNGVVSTATPDLNVFTGNNVLLGAEEANYLSMFLGETVSPVEGDYWSVSSITEGAYPGEFGLFGGTQMEMLLFTRDTGLYADRGFYVAPDLSTVELPLFRIQQADSAGNILYEAAAFVVATNTSVVPIPAALWLFGSGLLGLIGLAKRRKV